MHRMNILGQKQWMIYILTSIYGIDDKHKQKKTVQPQSEHCVIKLRDFQNLITDVTNANPMRLEQQGEAVLDFQLWHISGEEPQRSRHCE